jgi:hypothetical protein
MKWNSKLQYQRVGRQPMFVLRGSVLSSKGKSVVKVWGQWKFKEQVRKLCQSKQIELDQLLVTKEVIVLVWSNDQYDTNSIHNFNTWVEALLVSCRVKYLLFCGKLFFTGDAAGRKSSGWYWSGTLIKSFVRGKAVAYNQSVQFWLPSPVVHTTRLWCILNSSIPAISLLKGRLNSIL